MEPMLRENRDIVVIRTTEEKLKRLDVAFYKSGTRYVLHRVMYRKGDVYYIRGDNTYVMERVPSEDILGILASFQRNGKTISTDNFLYRLYAFIWTVIYPVRFLKHCVGSILRKLGLRK